MQGSMLFAIPWSFAAVADSDSREKFDRFYRDLITDKNEDFHIPASINKLEAVFPDAGRVQDFCFEVWSYYYYCCCCFILIIITKFDWHINLSKLETEAYFPVRWCQICQADFVIVLKNILVSFILS